jgi:hypothetical protein
MPVVAYPSLLNRTGRLENTSNRRNEVANNMKEVLRPTYWIAPIMRGVRIAQSVQRRVANRTVEVQLQAGSFFFLFRIVQTGSGAHQSSSSMGTGGSFPGSKEVGA